MKLHVKMRQGLFYLPTYPFIPIATSLLRLPTCQLTHPPFRQFTFYSPVYLTIHSPIHPSIHPLNLLFAVLTFWEPHPHLFTIPQNKKMRISPHLSLPFILPGLSEFAISSMSLPCSLPQPPDSRKFLHSIFSVEINLPPLYPKPSLHHVTKAHSTVSVESQCHQSAASAFAPTKQVVGEVAACDLGVAFSGGILQRRGSLSSETSPLAHTISGLKLKELGGICSDLKLIVHHTVFPLCPPVWGLVFVF